MLGHVLFDRLHEGGVHEVWATVRTADGVRPPLPLREWLVPGVQADRLETLAAAVERLRPDVVVNCIGLIKQRPAAEDPVAAIGLNALFPHQVARMCGAAGARLVHISTDCVFDGTKGKYTEADIPNALDIYGRTKTLGEVTAGDAVTLRTSFIGHELREQYGLVEWLLSQAGPVKGFRGAVYSGFPSVELARIVEEHVIPRPDLRGVYHVSSSPISKYELLRLVAEQYGRRMAIEPDDSFRVDRSLDSSRFRGQTGYEPPAWPEMVRRMHAHFRSASVYRERRV
jgi:dTDP-4-dehydrorhamnose reductase